MLLILIWTFHLDLSHANLLSALVVLVVGSFIYFAHYSGSKPGSEYVPAHMENGRFVPGTTR